MNLLRFMKIDRSNLSPSYLLEEKLSVFLLYLVIRIARVVIYEADNPDELCFRKKVPSIIFKL